MILDRGWGPPPPAVPDFPERGRVTRILGRGWGHFLIQLEVVGAHRLGGLTPIPDRGSGSGHVPQLTDHALRPPARNPRQGTAARRRQSAASPTANPLAGINRTRRAEPPPRAARITTANRQHAAPLSPDAGRRTQRGELRRRKQRRQTDRQAALNSFVVRHDALSDNARTDKQ